MTSGDQSPSSTEQLPPRNTIVVMPKNPPVNRPTLWLVFWGIGLLMGLFLQSLIETPTPDRVEAGTTHTAVEAAGAAPTFEVNVKAVLELPTATPTPLVMSTADAATVTSTINECTSAEPGKVCQVPFPPAPTATPYPSCLEMDHLTPGTWCMWPAASPTAARSASSP